MSVLPAYSVGTARPQASDLWRSVPLIPRNVMLVLLLGYRATISLVYGDVCKYFPSCSAYAVGAVQQYGAVRGAVLTVARLARCHPWAAGGVDDVPLRDSFGYQLTRRGFVVAVPGRKD